MMRYIFYVYLEKSTKLALLTEYGDAHIQIKLDINISTRACPLNSLQCIYSFI